MATEPAAPDFIQLIGAQMDAAMAKLEVRLIDRFASKKEHEQDMEILTARLTDHEKESKLRHDNLSERVGSLEQSRAGALVLSVWQRWLFGGLLFAITGSLVYLAAWHWH